MNCMLNSKTLAGATLLAGVMSGSAVLMIVTGCDNDASSTSTTTTGAGSMTTASADAITLEFDVKGMSCEGCVFSVRTAIAELDGVESCDVSLAEERAVVAVNDAATEQKIIEAIEKLDFTIARRGMPTAKSAEK